MAAVKAGLSKSELFEAMLYSPEFTELCQKKEDEFLTNRGRE